jgi:hypothetical protein
LHRQNTSATQREERRREIKEGAVVAKWRGG